MQEGVYTVLPTCVSTSWYVQFVLYTVGRLFSRESAVKRPVHQVFVGVQPKTPERRSVRISDDEARRSWPAGGVQGGFQLLLGFCASGPETGLQRLWGSIVWLLASNRVRGEF